MSGENLGSSEIVDLYTRFPATEISKMTGWTLFHIYQALREEGVERRPQGSQYVLNIPTGDELLVLITEAGSQRELAREMGWNRRTIQRRLAEKK